MKMKNVLFAFSFVLFLPAVSLHAQIGKRFPSERKLVKDPVTGVMLTFLTSTPAGDSKIYQTHNQWTADGQWLIFRSGRVRVDIAPGVLAPNHSHPGEEIIYVLEGTFVYEVEGQAPVTLKAGDVLFIPAGKVHSAKNIGKTNAAELATYIVEKGKPLVVLKQ